MQKYLQSDYLRGEQCISSCTLIIALLENYRKWLKQNKLKIFRKTIKKIFEITKMFLRTKCYSGKKYLKKFQFFDKGHTADNCCFYCFSFGIFC